MRPPCKRVGIVGGGLGGLTAIKALKEEGIEPVCFEKSDSIGGTWNYREEDIPDLPSIMWTTSINHSKEFYYSNETIPKEYPNYMRHFRLFEVMKNYFEKHGVTQHVTLNRKVVRVERASDYEETGRWSVTVKNTKNGEIAVEIFDGVFVSVGHVCKPKMAEYPGMNEFSGEIIHTHSLKRVDRFYNKKVTVVGTGCSALDAAVEISSLAKQVYLSVRTPAWILSRVGPDGMPIDYTVARRHFIFLQKILPLRWVSWIMEHYMLNTAFNHKLYGIKPKYPFLSHDPIVSDGIASKLLSGAVVYRKDITRFTKDGVVFDGEKEPTETDTVIMGTGYSWNFDFLEEDIVQLKDGIFNLYKCMYPTHLKHPTLAIIGFVLPFGPVFAIEELQQRWAAHLLARGKTLPNKEIMVKDTKDRNEENKKRYSPSEKMSIRVDYVQYCDELATEIGAMPNFWKMALTDPKLFFTCIFGACVPYQYRLVGPYKWKGAREAILTSSERMQAPLSPERLKRARKTPLTLQNLFIMLMIMCLLGSNDLSLKFYFGALFMLYYLLYNTISSKIFVFFGFLPYLFNWSGFAAMYALTIATFVYINFGNIVVNRYFWT